MSFTLFIVYILCTYLRPFEMFAPELNVYRPMFILLGLAMTTSIARALSDKQVAAQRVHFGLLGLLVATIGLSQVANQWAGGALAAIGDFSASAVLMVLCFLNLTSLRRLQITCVAILCSVVALAALGTYSFHTGYMANELVLKQSAIDDNGNNAPDLAEASEIPAQDKSGRYFLRLRSLGFLNDPNDFAQVMVMVLPLLWWVAQPGRWLRNLFVVGVPGAVLGYAIYLTQSRGALLGVGALLVLLMHRVLGTIKTGLLAASALIALGAISIGGRTLSTNEESAAQRIEAWYEGWKMLRSKPLFGVGYGNFVDHHYLTAHNSFVLCFAELGLIGYFAWLGLIVLTFQGLNRAVRFAPEGSPERTLAVLLRASLTAYMACAWFLSRSYQPGLYVVLSLGIASWFCTRRLMTPEQLRPPVEPIPWPRATLMAVVLSISGVYMFIVAQRAGA